MNGVESQEYIIVKGAKTNNLKNIDINIPINKFTCFTGISGGGKSSLVYETIYAESQRSFLESMSINKFGQKLMDKPDVEKIENLRAAISLSQNYHNCNPRSTIGTLTNTSQYIRAFFTVVVNILFNTNLRERDFSFNNPNSCCSYCNGLGQTYFVSEELLIPNQYKTLKQGAILYYKGSTTSQQYQVLLAICAYYNINIDKEVIDLTECEKYNLLYNDTPISIEIKFKTPKGRIKKKSLQVKGAIIELTQFLENKEIPSSFAKVSKYVVSGNCQYCNGMRLNNEILNYKIKNKNISEVEHLSLNDFIFWIIEMKSYLKDNNSLHSAATILNQILPIVNALIEMKLQYLSLDRSMPTLSGGEIQRVRIASQLNCSLNALIYILDEPCRGLHYIDINAIILAVKKIVARGNTVIAIEHNNEFISSADSVVELGPAGGEKGGYILNNNKNWSNKNNYVLIENQIQIENNIEFDGVTYNNINCESFKIPINCITFITGVSGSGKSSLAKVVHKSITSGKAIHCKTIKNYELIKRVMKVDQRPIGKTPRSTIVSYLDIYSDIRGIFSSIDKAKEQQLTSSDFSMNMVGGRCENCSGTGLEKIELNYLPTTYIKCTECGGNRFADKILNIKYNGYSILDVLESPIDEIFNCFKDDLNINKMLTSIIDVGLGYLKLGQMSMNLSGGESQRIKLAKAIGKKNDRNSIYILDEPTVGLNYSSIENLRNILIKLKNDGNTIIIIEHNLDLLFSTAEFVLDFGVEAGVKGGKIVSYGPIKEVINDENSSIFKYLSTHKINVKYI